MKVAIIPYVEYLNNNLISKIKTSDIIIGVDSGNEFLIKHNINVDLAIGDFDSLSNNEVFEKIQVIEKHDQMKDKTDTRLAIEAAINNFKPTKIMIFTNFHGRIDHQYALINLISLFEQSICIYDNNSKITNLNKGSMQFCGKNKYLSIFAKQENTYITSKGLKYELNKTLIPLNSDLGISNQVLKQTAIIKVDSGQAIIMEIKEEK